MLRHSSATPCPVPAAAPAKSHGHENESGYSQSRPQNHASHHYRRASTVSTFGSGEGGNDSTANIDFTAAVPQFGLGAGLKNAKPRRLRQGPGKRSDLGFAICEDDEAALGSEDRLGNRRNGSASAIAQPPQRLNRSVDFLPAASLAPSTGRASYASRESPVASLKDLTKAGSRRLSQAPRRPIAKADNLPPPLALPSLPEDGTITLPPMTDSTTMLKPARRGTIYIPTEDTTMPSMYMGLFSPIKNLDAAKTAAATTSGLMDPSAEERRSSGEITGLAAQIMAKRRRSTASGMSAIAASPKIGVLQTSARNLQGSAIVEDRWGQGGGKENVPPGQSEFAAKKVKQAKRMPLSEGQGAHRAQQQASAEARVSRIYQSTASSMARASNDKNPTHPAGAKPTWNGGPRLKTSPPIPVHAENLDPKSTLTKPAAEEVETRKPSVPSRFVMPRVETQPLSDMFPVLTEDLAHPSMYEDNWLNHQEVAITQLINNLFEASSSSQAPVENGMLRFRLLERHSSSENVMLYKRLRAALLYGALSFPSETLKGAPRLSSDLGRRKAFTDFWLNTYDLHVLRYALEVVVGRQCTISPRISLQSRSSLDNDQGVSRCVLQSFIEAFLIRNEDGSPGDSPEGRTAWSYQRTLLRSLMLIKLLDNTQIPQDRLLTCLFQPSSQYKSSAGVVHGLFQLLNPSAGDPLRALGHVGYAVVHKQYALEEYSYQMENIAVDLRDGVRLTRLVEILLYPSASPSLEHLHQADSTTTVLLPTGESLSLTEGERDWPLSQHLHFPCHGRATKLYNVQVALSALEGVKGMTAVVDDIEAEDIVDGFREKTVRLLWGLTSKWGLGGLVDWDDVEREIKRLCRTGDCGQDNDYFDAWEDEEDHRRQRMLLKSWAQAVASQRGLAVKNLTTSFADGQVFEAIVDEYKGFLCSDKQALTDRPLWEKLRALGCSEQFAKLFSTPQGSHNRPHLFDRDFVIAALAFLCSRLLGPSRSVRAAVTIQKAWRSRWARVLDERKSQLKAVAEACVQSFQDRKVRTTHCGGEAGFGSNDRGGIAYPGEEDIWLAL